MDICPEIRVEMIGRQQSDVVFYKLTAQTVSARDVWQDSLEYYISLGLMRAIAFAFKRMTVVGGNARKRGESQADYRFVNCNRIHG